MRSCRIFCSLRYCRPFNPSLSADKLLEGRLHEFELPMMPVSKSTTLAGPSVSPVGNLFVRFSSLGCFSMLCAGSLKLRFILKFPLSMKNAS
jgi:hypothetical protein